MPAIPNGFYRTSEDLNECLKIKFFNTQEAKKEKLFPNVEKFIEQYNKNS